MNDLALKIKEKIYPFTTKILDLVVKFQMIRMILKVLKKTIGIITN